MLLSDLWGEKKLEWNLQVISAWENFPLSRIQNFRKKEKRIFKEETCLASFRHERENCFVSFHVLVGFCIGRYFILFETDPGERERGYKKAEFGSI